MSSRERTFNISLMMLVVILVACSPSAEQIAQQTADKGTEITAPWTDTPTITVTSTATQTATITPLPLPRPEGIDESWELLHLESFDLGSQLFPAREVGGCTISVRDGKSVWNFLSTSGSNGLALNASIIGDLSDFFISVEGKQIACSGNCSYGLKFRSGSQYGYFFSIFERKQVFNFELVNFSGAGKTYNLETFTSSIIPDGANTIAVLAQDNEISLFVNDVMISQIQDSTNLAGKVGIIVTSSKIGSEAVFEFDNFQVYGE
jgi:hypothetical protein